MILIFIRSFITGNSEVVNCPIKSPSIVSQYIAYKGPSNLAPTYILAILLHTNLSHDFYSYIKFSTTFQGRGCMLCILYWEHSPWIFASLATFHWSGLRLNVASSKRLSPITLFKVAHLQLNYTTPFTLFIALVDFLKNLFTIYLHSLECKVHKYRELNYFDQLSPASRMMLDLEQKISNY